MVERIPEEAENYDAGVYYWRDKETEKLAFFGLLFSQKKRSFERLR